MSDNLVNPFNHNQQSLNPCNEKSPITGIPNEDPTPKLCPDCDDEPNLNDVANAENSWLEDASNKKIGLGHQANCDPMQTGQIVNDISNPTKNVVYRYPNALNGNNEAVTDLFRNIIVEDDDGKAHPVPIIWGTQERAVAAIIQDNVRKDESLVVDRIKLPFMAINATGLDYDRSRYTYHRALDFLTHLRPDGKPGFTNQEKNHPRDTVFGLARGVPVNISYTLYVWTLYLQDMEQIIQQILLKFSPDAYISVRGVNWEVPVKLDSISNNIDVEPGDQHLRVIKYEFNLTAETYIPQPIVRHKAVLSTKVDFFDKVNTDEITDVLYRLEETVKELKEC